MQFVGIGGLAPGGDLAGFIEQTGTDGFVQLDDADGALWQLFGTGGRSTFMFVNDDGSFILTDYGVVDEERLGAEVQRLIET